MHWVVATLLMFVASIVLYLSVRRASLDKLPVHFNNLASFSVPLTLFTVGALITRQSFVLSLREAGILLVSGVFLSYLANKFSLKSIELAPNPGYSLVISKSYVVMTAFLAVPLFGAHLSVTSLVAIALIVGFAALIMLGSGERHRAKSTAWLPLAFLAFFGWGFLTLVAKYLFSQGMSPVVFLIYTELVVVTCILIEMYRKRVLTRSITKHIKPFVLIGLCSAAFNFFHFTAISLAPNVGYVNATNAASIAAVTVFAALLFKDDLSIKKVIGVFGVTTGLFLLFLG